MGDDRDEETVWTRIRPWERNARSVELDEIDFATRAAATQLHYRTGLLGAACEMLPFMQGKREVSNGQQVPGECRAMKVPSCKDLSVLAPS